MNHIVGDVHYAVFGLRGSRTILTVHDTFHLDRLTGLRKVIYRWLYFSWPLRRCRIVTAISDHTRDRLIQLFPFLAGKIHVIPDCVPEGFRSSAKRFNPSRPRILQVGTTPHKNLDRVIAAISGEPYILHIVGPLTDEQQGALQRAGVAYENGVNISDAELYKAYEQADLVTFVSLFEGFGMPIIEAQAVGRPLVTSDLSPMRDVAGTGACTVNPHSPEEIRAAIRRIVEDEDYRNNLVAAGFENVRRFAAAEIGKHYAELYERVSNPDPKVSVEFSSRLGAS